MKNLFANNKFRFCFLLFIISEIIWLLTSKLSFDTDLLSLIQDKTSSTYSITKLLSKKYSNKISILAIGDDKETTINSINSFKNTISKDFFIIENNNINFNIKNFIKDFSKYSGKLLSEEDRNYLKSHDFDNLYKSIVLKSLSSFTPRLFSFKTDPFLFLQDFLLNIPTKSGNWNTENGTLIKKENNKFYALIFVSLKDDKNLTNFITFNALFNLKETRKSFETTSTKIYVSGAPFYTAIATKNSKKEINILSIASCLFLLSLGYFLFKHFKFLVPIFLSIGFGFLAGIFSLFLFFDSVHILTLIFGTTLIGLSVDYSLHFLIAKNNFNTSKEALDHIFKNLTFSLLTTIIAFLPLLFSNFSLLKQMALFSATGLIFVYLFVCSFYVPLTSSWKKDTLPNNKGNYFAFIKILRLKKERNFIFSLGIIIFIMFCTYGISSLKTSDNIQNFYSPPKDLLKDDIMFQKSTMDLGKYFLVIKGSSIEDALQKEENLSNQLKLSPLRLSSFIPSIRTQKENLILTKLFLNAKKTNFKNDLSINLPSFKPTDEFLTFDTVNNNLKKLLSSFLIIDNNNFYLINSLIEKPVLDYKKRSDLFLINFTDDIISTFKSYRHETYKLLCYSFLILIFFLSCIFKGKSFLLIFPSFFSILSLLSLFGILGIPLTFFHFLSFFLLTGLSLDYAIFSLNSKNDFTETAVFFSFLTSFVSFGLLFFTSFTLTKNLGITISMGLAFSFIISYLIYLKKT